MIKLKLPLQTAILYAKNAPDSAYAQAALAVYAYQEAVDECPDIIFVGGYPRAWIHKRAAEKLKKWGVECDA